MIIIIIFQMINVMKRGIQMKKIVLAGGCFWGMESYFDTIYGVLNTKVGYANGDTENPTYEKVCKNNTGFAEACFIEYDEEKTSLNEILKAYFKVIDPTILNRQGGDTGIQYRTGIYYIDENDRNVIVKIIEEEQKKYNDKIVTEVLPLKNFYDAEEYHQKYLEKHPDGYCHIPKEIINRKKILILGASGLSGNAIADELCKNTSYEVYGTYRNNKIKNSEVKAIKFEAEDKNKVKDIIEAVKPSHIVYCLNGDFNMQFELIEEIVKCIKESSVKFYFCSTGNVFDGDPKKVHFRNEKPEAESDYGKFKIKCENILKENLGERAVILRLSAIWGKDSKRMNSLISKIKNNEKIDVYLDTYLNNNTDVMLAKQVRYIIENDLKGTFHMGSTDVIGYGDIIKKIAEGLHYKNVKYNNIKTSDEKYYLAVLPKDEFPKDLNITSQEIIDYLVQS